MRCDALPASNCSSLFWGSWGFTPKVCFSTALEPMPVPVRPCSRRNAAEDVPHGHGCMFAVAHGTIVTMTLWGCCSPVRDPPSPPHSQPVCFHIRWGEKAVRGYGGRGGICWREKSVKQQILFTATASAPEGWWNTFLGALNPFVVCWTARMSFTSVQLFYYQQRSKLDLSVWLLGFCELWVKFAAAAGVVHCKFSMLLNIYEWIFLGFYNDI